MHANVVVAATYIKPNPPPLYQSSEKDEMRRKRKKGGGEGPILLKTSSISPHHTVQRLYITQVLPQMVQEQSLFTKKTQVTNYQ